MLDNRWLAVPGVTEPEVSPWLGSKLEAVLPAEDEAIVLDIWALDELACARLLEVTVADASVLDEAACDIESTAVVEEPDPADESIVEAVPEALGMDMATDVIDDTSVLD